MPTSKHRRKGKLRPRGKVNDAIPPMPIDDPEHHRQQDALLMAQLKKMYGGTDWGDWTEPQIYAALKEIEREGDAMMPLTTAEEHAEPTPQQQEPFSRDE